MVVCFITLILCKSKYSSLLVWLGQCRILRIPVVCVVPLSSVAIVKCSCCRSFKFDLFFCVLVCVLRHTAVTCPDLSPTDNGRQNGSSFTFTSVVVFACDLGYNLTGNQQLVCQANATWSAEQPTCVSK